MSDNQLEFCTSISRKSSENGNFWAISIFSSSKVEIDLGKKNQKVGVNEKSTNFAQFLWNFVNLSQNWVGQFDQVSS